MNRVFISLFSLAVLAGLFARFVWETYYPSIRSVSVTPLVVDLGNVVQRSGVAEAKFILHNTTRKQVSITRTLSSCRCNDLIIESVNDWCHSVRVENCGDLGEVHDSGSHEVAENVAPSHAGLSKRAGVYPELCPFA